MRNKKIKIGIECESIESDSWGVARLVSELLEEVAHRPELANEFVFFLYFKSRIPDHAWLKNPIFKKRITKPPLVPASFNLHYHVWLLMCAYWDNVQMLYFPAYQLPLLWFKKSVVMTTDDIYYEMRNPQLPFRFRLSYSIFGNWAAHRATRIMAISESSAKELVRLFRIDQKRVVVNPLAVDAVASDNSKLVTRNYILYVGQAFPRRHLKETMLAFEKIARDFPELKFIAVGADKYQPPVVARLSQEINKRLGSERVTHYDYVPEGELAKLYAGAKACIYVSDREAFGLPPLEALAHGTIAVVADKPVSHEVFGEAAVFVKDPDSADSIAHAMRQALTDTALHARIEHSRPAILLKYTWQKHADRFITLMRDLCSKN